MRWWPRHQLMYLELYIFKCFLNAHSRQLFGRTVSLASTHGRIFRNVPDRLHIPHVSVNTNDCEATPCFTDGRIFRNVPDSLHIPHVSVNTNDCEATPCFTHKRIFRSVPDRLVIPNILVTMNDCVDRLAVLYM